MKPILIQVRRNNSQCGYGPWYQADDQDVPRWVIEYAHTERTESGATSGQVERGGSKWDWREPKPTTKEKLCPTN